MLVYGKNVLYEIDRSKIKKAYISRNDYMAYLKENNIKYEYVDKNRLDKMEGMTMKMLITTGIGVMIVLILAVLQMINL